MMKWLLLAVVVVGVLWWLGRGRKPPGGGAAPVDSRAQRPPSKTAAPEPMVACAHCGMLLPQAEAVKAAESAEHYCCEAHRRAGPSAG